MEKRLTMAFDGWASQFKHPPTWRPKIETKNQILYLDNQPLHSINKEAASISIDTAHIRIYWDTGNIKDNSLICIERPYESEPYIKKIFQNQP